MKKSIVMFSTIIFAILIIISFAGCTNNASIDKNVSDIRYRIFDGEFEDYSITLMCGLREKPYYLDGIANEKVEFAIISVLFLDEINESENVYFSLKVNEDIFSGILEKSPYTDQYMADVGRVFADTDNISIEVYLNETANSDYEVLTNKSVEWRIDYEKALKNGVAALSSEIDFFKKNGLSYEIHLKILTEQKSNFGEYFWSVSLISSEGRRHNVVFGINSTDILVKN